MFLEENTLSEALTFARVRELPKKYNPELGLTWILAVALIKKKELDDRIRYRGTEGGRAYPVQKDFRAVVAH